MNPSEQRTRSSHPAHEAWVSCSRCQRLHRVRELLAFEPLCPPCAAG